MSQIQSYKNSRSFYYNETLEKKKDPPSPFFLSHQGRGVLGSMASNSFAHRVCEKNQRFECPIYPSPPWMLKIPIYRGGEKKRGGGIWVLTTC